MPQPRNNSRSNSSKAHATDGFEYDAFISYRHIDPDRRIAIWLHSKLEKYRVPKRLVEQLGVPPRVKRVFRDEDELSASSDLGKELEDALRKSRFLIVICSPRTPKSEWVSQEVQRFREWGRDDRILALLIEGQPRDSFPRPLREIRRTIVDESGAEYTAIEEVEPLAADLRPRHKEKGGHLRRMAKLRILACLLGCKFDHLRQREQERQMRRLVWAGAFFGFLALLLAGLTAFALKQRREADHQRSVAITNEKAANENAERADRNAEARRLALIEEEKAKIKERDAKINEQLAKDRAIRTLYFSKVQEAFEKWQKGNLTEAEAILDGPECPESLRSWEWSYVKRLCHSELLKIDLGGFQPAKLVISPDGQTIAVASENSTTRQVLLQAFSSAGAEKWRTPGPARIWGIAFSPDNSLLVTGDSLGTIRTWIAATGKPGQAIEAAHESEKKGAPYGIESVAFSPDGKQIFSHGRDHRIRIWDATSAKQVGEIRDGSPSTVAFDPASGRFALCLLGQQSLQVLSNSKEMLFRVSPLPNLTTALAFSPDGKRLAWGGTFGLVKVWDVANSQQLLSFQGHRALVTSVAFSADGQRLATVSDDRIIKLWDVNTGREIVTIRGHRDNVTAVALHPKTGMLVSASADKTIKFWSTANDQSVLTMRDIKGDPHQHVFRPDSRELAILAGYQIRGENLSSTPGSELTFWDVRNNGFAKRAEVNVTGGKHQESRLFSQRRNAADDLRTAKAFTQPKTVPSIARAERTMARPFAPD